MHEFPQLNHYFGSSWICTELLLTGRWPRRASMLRFYKNVVVQPRKQAFTNTISIEEKVIGQIGIKVKLSLLSSSLSNENNIFLTNAWKPSESTRSMDLGTNSKRGCDFMPTTDLRLCHTKTHFNVFISSFQIQSAESKTVWTATRVQHYAGLGKQDITLGERRTFLFQHSQLSLVIITFN